MLANDLTETEPRTTKPQKAHLPSSSSHAKLPHRPQTVLPSRYPDELKGEVTCMNFNEKATRLIVGTTCGYFVYDINRCTLLFSKVPGKAVGLAELLGNTNLVILSGYISSECSMEPIVDRKTLLFWNDETDSEIDRIILPDLIQKVKVRRERIYVSYCSTIAVYAARGLELLATIHTGKVPLFDISYQGDFTVVCVDGMAGNSVRVCAESLENLRHFKYGPSIKAHEHDVTAIAVSPNNSLFATVSDGKNIRLSRMDGKLFNLLHRGNSAVSARAIAFSPNGSLIAMISSNGTGHVFEKSYSNSYTYSLSTKSLYASFKWDSAEVLIFSSDSSKIIVASKEEVRLYSVFLDRTKGYLALSQGGCYNFLRDKREGSIFVKSN